MAHVLTQSGGRQRRSGRRLAVAALGPLTVAAGLGWGLLQPYRVTLLHPHGKGFWWLAVEPPLLVVAVGIVFHLLVARSLLRELRAEERGR